MIRVQVLLHGSVSAALTMCDITFHGLSASGYTCPEWTVESSMESRTDLATERFNCTLQSAQRFSFKEGHFSSEITNRFAELFPGVAFPTSQDDIMNLLRTYEEAHAPATKSGKKLRELCQAAPGPLDYRELKNALADVAAEEICAKKETKSSPLFPEPSSTSPGERES